MAERLNRGEIRLLDRPRPDKRRPVRQGELGAYVGTVSREKMAQVCRALAIACACE